MSYHVPGIMLDAGNKKVNKTNVILAFVEFAAIMCVCVCLCIYNNNKRDGKKKIEGDIK